MNIGNSLCAKVLLVSSLLPATVYCQADLTEPHEQHQNRLQPPDRVMDAIGLKPGMILGEVGAGFGRYTVHLARRVGAAGLVYANDIDKGALAHLQLRCKRNNLRNVKVILGKPDNPGFPPNSLDMAFMINVYNAFEDPVGFLRNIAPALKPGGTLAVVLDDPAKSGGESARSATRAEFLGHAEKAGYKVVKEETFLRNDGLYILRPKDQHRCGCLYSPQGLHGQVPDAGPRPCAVADAESGMRKKSLLRT